MKKNMKKESLEIQRQDGIITTLATKDETPQVDPTRVVYAQAIEQTNEPSYQEVLAAKEAGIRDSRETEMQRRRERDSELVEGRFDYKEMRGGTHEFFFGPMYKGDKTTRYTLVDGHVYKIPRGVAVHLNESGIIEVHETAKAEDGITPHFRVGQKLRRYGFYPTSFENVGQNDEPSGLITSVKRIF